MIGHERTINGLDWSPDGQSIVAGDRDGVVNIWDVNTKSVIKSIEQHSGPVRVAVWSPDGRFLATSDGDTCVNISSTSDWEKCGRIDSNGRGTLAIAFSPDSRFMMFGGYGGGLFLIDLTDINIKQQIATTLEVSAISFIDQNNLVVGGIEGAMESYTKVRDDWELVREETLSHGWIRSIRTSLSKCPATRVAYPLRANLRLLGCRKSERLRCSVAYRSQKRKTNCDAVLVS